MSIESQYTANYFAPMATAQLVRLGVVERYVVVIIGFGKRAMEVDIG